MDLERLTRAEMFDFHGVSMTHYYTDNWENLQNFQAKPDDILIASFPRSEIAIPVKEVKEVVYKSEKMIMYADGSGTTFTGVEHANSISASPRLIKTHLPVQFVPESFWKQNCKIVYVARNPKDNMVSYFHFDQRTLLQPEPGDWSNYFHRFLQGKMVCGSWYDHVNNWWKKKETYSNLHYVFYEDMMKDTRQEVDKVCSFFNLPRSSEEKDRITAKVQFHEMKDNPIVNHTDFEGFNSSESTFLRKGKVGDWKNYFTVAQNEEFEEDYKKKMNNFELMQLQARM